MKNDDSTSNSLPRRDLLRLAGSVATTAAILQAAGCSGLSPLASQIDSIMQLLPLVELPADMTQSAQLDKPSPNAVPIMGQAAADGSPRPNAPTIREPASQATLQNYLDQLGPTLDKLRALSTRLTDELQGTLTTSGTTPTSSASNGQLPDHPLTKDDLAAMNFARADQTLALAASVASTWGNPRSGPDSLAAHVTTLTDLLIKARQELPG